MAKKLLKKLKKVAKIAVPVLGALALAKRAKSKAVSGTDEGGIHVRHNAFKDFGPYTHKRFDPTTVNPNKVFGDGVGFKGGGIAKRGTGAAFKKGGHVKSMGIAKRGGGIAKR